MGLTHRVQIETNMEHNMSGGKILSVGLMILLLALTGCSKYTITFQVQDAINTGGLGAKAAEQLDVDIVCLSKSDMQKFPGLAENRVWSDEWFNMRDTKAADFRALGKSRIFALRNGQATGDDTLLGSALVPGRDTDQKERTVTFVHHAGLSGDSAIVIYGRFKDGKGGLLKGSPVIVKPIPTWNPRIRISVGATEMTRLEQK